MLKMRKNEEVKWVAEKNAKHFITRGWVVIPNDTTPKKIDLEKYAWVKLIRETLMSNSHPSMKYFNVAGQSFGLVKTNAMLVKKETLKQWDEDGIRYEIQ